MKPLKVQERENFRNNLFRSLSSEFELLFLGELFPVFLEPLVEDFFNFNSGVFEFLGIVFLGSVKLNTVGTTIAIRNKGLHSSGVFSNGSPFPGVFATISENEVRNSEVPSSCDGVGGGFAWVSDVFSIDLFAKVSVDFEVETGRSEEHLLVIFKGSLEPTELSAGLVNPLSHVLSFAVGSVVNLGESVILGVSDFRSVFHVEF